MRRVAWRAAAAPRRYRCRLNEFLYAYNSLAIVLTLFVLTMIANEAGYRVGLRHQPKVDEGTRSQTNSIQAAMLGLLALLLGFTFTMALQRFDTRSQAVIDEANAIGTAYLRTELLPDQLRTEARDLFDEYLQLRVQMQALDLTRMDRRSAKAAISRLQHRLWDVSLRAAEIDPRPSTTGLLIQSLNSMFDAYASRDAALQKHVPEVVLLVLFAVFMIAGSVLGYAGGLHGARPMLATVAMTVLIILVIFLILDLDRPRRGLIRVNQDSMSELSGEFATERSITDAIRQSARHATSNSSTGSSSPPE